MGESTIGFHYSIGGTKTGIGAFMEKLNQNGIPFLMKGTDDAGLCFEGHMKGLQYGVDNHLIYRVSTAGQDNGIEYDVPDYTISPTDAAQEHFNKTAAKWPPELDRAVVWMEPINEPRAKLSEGDIQWNNMHPVDWLGYFMYEYAKVANAQGFKVCGPSFNSGEPMTFSTNDYELPGMLAYLQYCADNPGKAALSVHEYSWDGWKQGQDFDDWYPHLYGRVEAAIAAADKHNIPRAFSIFVTEWGFGQNDAPRWPACEPHLTKYNEWTARFPQVKGAATWTLAIGWGGVDDDLQTWFAPLADYAVNNNFDSGPQPAQTHTAFGGTLPGGNPVKTLEQTIWEASQAAYAAEGIKLPNALGLWKKITENTTGYIPAHNEKSLIYEGKKYAYQGAIDPKKTSPYKVGIWTKGKSIWFIEGPGNPEPPPTPAPFEFEAYPVPQEAYVITNPFNAPRPNYPAWTNHLHEGIDLRAPLGRDIVSVADGVVDKIRPDPGSGYGNYVRVDHDGRYKTTYGHLKDWIVELGQIVTAGQVLGHADNTGNSSGSHLHLTLYDLVDGLNGYIEPKVVDPTPFLDAVATPPQTGINLLQFMLADPTAWRVVKSSGGQEDIQDLDLGNGLYVRRKNSLGEWWKHDAGYFYLIHDTSPAPDSAGNERVYTLTKNGEVGAPKNPAVMELGQSWTESGSHHVQFRKKNGCGLLEENSGYATNTAVLIDHKTSHTFNTYGQNLTLDEVVWIKTGVETQVYARHNGKAVGWCGWDSPWNASEIVELHWDRPPMVEEPTRYCSW